MRYNGLHLLHKCGTVCGMGKGKPKQDPEKLLESELEALAKFEKSGADAVKLPSRKDETVLGRIRKAPLTIQEIDRTIVAADAGDLSVKVAASVVQTIVKVLYDELPLIAQGTKNLCRNAASEDPKVSTPAMKEIRAMAEKWLPKQVLTQVLKKTTVDDSSLLEEALKKSKELKDAEADAAEDDV